MKFLFHYCQKKIPPRFFDILYQNENIFKEDSDTDTEFLPKIHFKNLWQCEISQKTKDTIWKYLQLIMFSIVSSMEDKKAFGDAAKFFEAINEDDLKSKFEEIMTQMHGFFDASANSTGLDGKINVDIPDAAHLHEHISSMLDGKLGNLAREIAEETATNLQNELGDITDIKDVFQGLIKNPTKFMNLVKTFGDKLDSKIKSGDLKESELITEATEMMEKMKNIPGMGNIKSMLDKMVMGGMGLGGKGKVNTGAMESNLNQKMKIAKTKERIRAKAELNAKNKAEAQQLQAQQSHASEKKISDEDLLKLFDSKDKVERTPRGTKPSQKSIHKKKGNK